MGEARTLNVKLLDLRERAGLSQQELADELNALAHKKFGREVELTKKTIGRWERGEAEWPQPFYRRLLAEYFDCAADELGFRRPQRAVPPPARRAVDEALVPSGDGPPDPRADRDQSAWLRVRRGLDRNRRELAVLAEQLYPNARIPGLENTGAIAPEFWLPAEPVPVRQVVLDLDTSLELSAVTGGEPESAQARPLASAETRYRRYSHATRDLAPPRLFENRLCYRVVGVDWTLPVVQFQFGVLGFFDAFDFNEAMAHETALHHLAADGRGELGVLRRASWRRLTFRKLVGDPFDLRRRPLMGAIGTLTIRDSESPSMVLHQRDGGRVAGGGGMIHLLPAGIFQPSSVHPTSVASDFSIWRNMQREFVEELLGAAEYDGSGQPIDYDHSEPFATMNAALESGRIRVYCLGLILDALTLAGDLLTVAVIDEDLYDELFCESVERNDEGSIPSRALPFEANTIQRLRDAACLSPGAAAALHLAWKYRAELLARRAV